MSVRTLIARLTEAFGTGALTSRENVPLIIITACCPTIIGVRTALPITITFPIFSFPTLPFISSPLNAVRNPLQREFLTLRPE